MIIFYRFEYTYNQASLAIGVLDTAYAPEIDNVAIFSFGLRLGKENNLIGE